MLGRAAACTGGLLLVVTWILSSISHFCDSSAVDHPSGTRAALAQYANDGVLYPALEHDGFYGGTRYMPGPILLHAAVAKGTGDYFIAARLLSCCYILASVGLLVILAARLKAGAVFSILLLSCVVLARPVWAAATSVSPDGLPLALQLSALLCVLGSGIEAPTRLRLVVAAVLCALAVFSKLSAVWAPAAILLCIVRRHPRRALFFFGAGSVAGGTLFGLTMLLSEGRFLSSALALSFATAGRGVDTPAPELLARLLSGAERILTEFAHYAPGILLLLPFAVATCMLARPQPRARLLIASTALSGLALLVTFTQDGAFTNHLIDLIATSTATVACFGLRLEATGPGTAPNDGGGQARSPYRMALGLAGLLSLAVGVTDARLIDRVREALSVTRGLPEREGTSRLSLLDVIPSGARLLSEHPGVCVARGERPVVLDSFLFLRASLERPSLSAGLSARISVGEFTHVVLQHPLDAENLAGWYAYGHFGPRVAAALAAHYRLSRVVDLGRQKLYVYVPQ